MERPKFTSFHSAPFNEAISAFLVPEPPPPPPLSIFNCVLLVIHSLKTIKPLTTETILVNEEEAERALNQIEYSSCGADDEEEEEVIQYNQSTTYLFRIIHYASTTLIFCLLVS